MSATLYCNFCGKARHEVKRLVAGPGVHICNECVDLCKAICDEECPPPGELKASVDASLLKAGVAG